MNTNIQFICVSFRTPPAASDAVPDTSTASYHQATCHPQGQPVPPIRELRFSVCPAASLTPAFEPVDVPTLIARLVPEPLPTAPFGSPPSNFHEASPCVLYRTRPFQAATARYSSQQPSGLTQPMTMFILLAAAVLVFLVAAAVLFHDPVTHVFRTRQLSEERKLLADRQEAEARALREAVIERLDQAEDALANLRSANDQFVREVEALVRSPLEPAVRHPPMHLRCAILASEDCLYAWTAVVNAYVTPQQFDAHRRCLDSIRTDLQQGIATQSHRRDLDSVRRSIRQRQDAIAMIDLAPLSMDNDIDAQAVTRTITLQERR